MRIRPTNCILILLAVTVSLAVSLRLLAADKIFLGQSVLAGEVTVDSVILLTRLTAAEGVIDGDVPGIRGVGRFEVDTNPLFPQPIQTEWQHARASNDFIIKSKVSGLKPDTLYYYRAWFGSHERQSLPDVARSFRTLGGRGSDRPVKFVIGGGMDYEAFHAAFPSGELKDVGYPVFGILHQLRPDFYIGNGDNVYYDSPPLGRKLTQQEMRRKWHEQFVQARIGQFFTLAPSFWLKGRHDDGHGFVETIEDGGRWDVFQDQLPVPEGSSYRTQRINRHLQLWFLGCPEFQEADAVKVAWGKKQMAWLKHTLEESDATFKIIVSPTPVLSREDLDLEVSTERDDFLGWLLKQKIGPENLFFVSGGTRCQFHVRGAGGFEEFSCGALQPQNSKTFVQVNVGGEKIYAAEKPMGGFLQIEQSITALGPRLIFIFKDETGAPQHHTAKTRAVH